MPDAVSIGGIEYAVNTDFRVWIEIGKLFSGRGDDLSRFERILMLAYRRKLPDTAEEAMAGVIDFYRAGVAAEDSSRDMPVLDLYDDFSMIAAAFMRDYRIDLWEEKLHWWKFRALFSGLSEENKIVKVMGYRSAALSDITDKKQRKFYARMKRLYRIEDTRTDEEKERFMIEQLNGAF